MSDNKGESKVDKAVECLNSVGSADEDQCKTGNMAEFNNRVDRAVECHAMENGFNCSQSIFMTYSEDFGIDREAALKLSCGLGGGMGRTGHVCGAVTGAVLILGLKYGRYKLEDKESKERTYSLVQEFEKQFIERNGTVVCDELLKINMRTADKDFIKALTKKECHRYIRDAAEILEGFL